MHGDESVASTLDLRFDTSGFFLDKIESQNADGTFPWGDYPWGGAVAVTMGVLMLVGAVSCLSEIEDDLVARLILGGIAKEIILGDGLLSED